MLLNILAVGDVVGEGGLDILSRRLDGLRHSREGADCGTLPQLIAALEKKKEALK